MAGPVTVYDAEGNAITLDHVDARDYLATGRYTSAPVDPEAAAAQAAADEAAREAAAKVMTAEKDGVAIHKAHPHGGEAPKGGSKTRQAKRG